MFIVVLHENKFCTVCIKSTLSFMCFILCGHYSIGVVVKLKINRYLNMFYINHLQELVFFALQYSQGIFRSRIQVPYFLIGMFYMCKFSEQLVWHLFMIDTLCFWLCYETPYVHVASLWWNTVCTLCLTLMKYIMSIMPHCKDKHRLPLLIEVVTIKTHTHKFTPSYTISINKFICLFFTQNLFQFQLH